MKKRAVMLTSFLVLTLSLLLGGCGSLKSNSNPSGDEFATRKQEQSDDEKIIKTVALPEKSGDEVATVALPEKSGDDVTEVVKSEENCDKKMAEEFDYYNEEIEEVYDPIEPFNRAVFSLNDVLYNYVFFPISDTYGMIMPNQAKTRVGYVFHNITTPVRVVGDLLQGKGEKAIIETCSLIFNSTFGLLGIFDIYEIDDNFDDEDISQGLASMGMSEGPYIVWLIFGPSNVRNTIGGVGDVFLTPYTYLGFPDNTIVGFGKVTNEYGISNAYRDLTSCAMDKYIAIKDAYTKNFKHRLKK